jgi:hypothetical protein
MKTPTALPASFDCRATAAILRSGSSVALAGHVAAIMSALSIWNGGPSGWIRWSSLLVWCAVVYLAVRVKIDVLFFELLAEDCQATQLDGWLEATGLRKNAPPRTIQERRSGALRLWRALAAAVGMQIVLMLLGMFRLIS